MKRWMKWNRQIYDSVETQPVVILKKVNMTTVMKFCKRHREIFKTSGYYAFCFMINVWIDALGITNNRHYFICDIVKRDVGIITVTRKTKKNTILYNVGIYPDERHKGYARAAISKILSYFDIISKDVYLSVNSKNYKAKSLYESLGFEYVKERKVNEGRN